MARIETFSPDMPDVDPSEVSAQIKNKYGTVSMLLRRLDYSPAAIEDYSGTGGDLARGGRPAKHRARVASVILEF